MTVRDQWLIEQNERDRMVMLASGHYPSWPALSAGFEHHLYEGNPCQCFDTPFEIVTTDQTMEPGVNYVHVVDPIPVLPPQTFVWTEPGPFGPSPITMPDGSTITYTTGHFRDGRTGRSTYRTIQKHYRRRR